MPDVVHVATTALSAAIVSSFSTTATIVLMRYFPRMLDNVERRLRARKTDRTSHGTKGPDA